MGVPVRHERLPHPDRDLDARTAVRADCHRQFRPRGPIPRPKKAAQVFVKKDKSVPSLPLPVPRMSLRSGGALERGRSNKPEPGPGPAIVRGQACVLRPVCPGRHSDRACDTLAHSAYSRRAFCPPNPCTFFQGITAAWSRTDATLSCRIKPANQVHAPIHLTDRVIPHHPLRSLYPHRPSGN